MRGPVAALALLVGCHAGDAPGVLIEVHSDTAVSRFELIYSRETCTACTQITPPSRLINPIMGTGWLSKDVERFPVELDAPSNRALFQLEASSVADQHVERAIIVALAGTPSQREMVVGVATLPAFDIPIRRSVKFEVKMLAADALSSQTDNEHVELWRRLDDGMHTACVVVEHAGGHAEFFVPFDDPDCDDPERVNAECDAFGYLSAGPPPLDQANCRAKRIDVTCRLGGPPCVEGSQPPPNLGTCVAVAPSYCLPQYICGLSCITEIDRACLGVTTTGVPYAECLSYTNNAQPCSSAMGNGTTATLPLQQLVLDTTTQGCKSIQIANIVSPLVFGDSVLLGDGGTNLTFTLNQLTFDAATCAIEISWAGAFSYAESVLVKIVTDTGVNRVVALRLKPVSPTCPGSTVEPFACTSYRGMTTDSLYSCQ